MMLDEFYRAKKEIKSKPSALQQKGDVSGLRRL